VDTVKLVVVVLLAACAAAWTLIIVRWRRRRPVLPYEARRPVPWRAADVLALLLVYVSAPALIAPLVEGRLPAHPGLPAPAAAGNVPGGRESARPAAQDGRPTTEHPLGRLLEESHNGPLVALVVVCLVVLAPVFEELLLRLLLQGWLESAEGGWRRSGAWLRRSGIVPVGVVSLCFAALHIRGAAAAEEMPSAAWVAAQAAASLATAAAIVLWLRLGVGATLADLGIAPRLWRKDVATGLVAWAAVTGPILVLFAKIRSLAPAVVVDPLPIFLLALVLGTLYYRTHRILPSIVLHAAFNATGVLLALASR